MKDLMKCSSIKILALLFSISITSNSYANENNSLIPIEKLVCYGQGLSQSLSPSGKYYAAMVPIKENVCDIKDLTMAELRKADRVLVVTDIDTMESKAISGTTIGSSVDGYTWLTDDVLLAYRFDRESLDDASIYTVTRDGKETKRLIEAKFWKNKPGAQYPSVFRTFPKFPNKIMITLNRGSVPYMFRDLYWLDINTKELTLVAKVPSVKNEQFAGWLVDWDGVPRGFETYTTSGDDMGLVTTFYKYNENGNHKKMYSCRHQEACFTPMRFDIDNNTVLGVGQAVQKDGTILQETDTNALWSYDFEKEEFIEMIYHDPDFDVSSPMQGQYSMSMWFDPTGSDLFGFSYEAEKTVNVYFDSYFQSVMASLENAFPGEEVRIVDWSSDLTRFLFNTSNSKNPGSTYFLDISKGSVSHITTYAPWLKDYEMAEMKPFTYIARDGLKLHGYITLPPGYKKGTKIPFILHPHGGPNARDYYGYNSEVQFYASRGYGVIQTNYRGSSGFGRKEMILANHQMGKTMQTDKYDALQWANEQGYVDMNNICISGASYGGYAAMHAATMEPDMFNCIITYVGTYDLTDYDLRGLMWSEVGMPMEYIEKGNPDIPEDYKNLYDNSPIFHVENVKKPVLIITGRRDRNVRFQETVDMVNQLKKFDKDYKYIIKGDEAHGFRRETARLELYQDYEAFLSEHLN